MAQIPQPLAQTYQKKLWTTVDGLPVNHAYEIDEDQEGFLWLATVEGLVRYDGISFTTFNKNKVPIFRSNAFQKIEALKDEVWFLAADRFLYRYQNGLFYPSPFSFQRVDHIWSDPASNLLYVVEDQNFHVVQQGKRIFSKRGVLPLYGRITGDGFVFHAANQLFHYKRAKNEVEEVSFSFLKNNVIYAYFYIEKENKYYVLDNLSRMWSYANGAIKRETAYDGATIVASEDQTPSTFTYFLKGKYYQKSFETEVVIATVYKDPNSQRAKYTQFSQASLAVSEHSVLLDHQLFETYEVEVVDAIMDRRGMVWVATTGGLWQYKKAPIHLLGKAQGLENEAVYWVKETQSGQVYGGSLTSGGVRWNGVRFLPQTVEGQPLSVITEDGRGNVWGGSGKICLIEKKDALTGCILSPINMNALNSIHRDQTGVFWLSYPDVLYKTMDLSKGWQKVTDQKGKDIATVYRIQEGSDGVVWFGTRASGLYRSRNGHVEQVLAPNQRCGLGIREIIPDSALALWLGTESNGVCHLALTPSGDIGKIIQIGTAQGLFQNSIHRILDDGMGRFWMNTNYGIFWVFKKDLNAYVAGQTTWVPSLAYTEEHGLLNREGNGGKQHAGGRMKDGTLWFPTMAGFAVIDPKTISPNLLSGLPAYLLGVESKGRSLSLSQEQTFSANTRDLTFYYSALSFDYPRNTLFRVRLEGYDESWRPATSQRSVNFTNLEQGAYQLYIQAGIGGKWGKETVYAFIIAPYWYETLWFRFFAVLGVLGLGYGGMRSRTAYLTARAKQLEETVNMRTDEIRQQQETLREQNDQLQRQTQQILEQAAQLKSLDETKSRLFINLAHEIRTPLTVITEPISLYYRRNQQALLPQDARMFETALQNGNRVLELVNQLLQIARLEAGMVTNSLSKARLGATIHGWVHGFFRGSADAKGVHLQVELPAQDILVETDFEKLRTILSNLVANAIKYSPPNTHVWIKLRTDADHGVQILVQDQGIGIKPEALEQIFTWYFRSPEHADSTGTGIGLSLSRELARSLKGDLSVKSQQGQGSTFTLTLPLHLETIELPHLPAHSAIRPSKRVDAIEPRPYLDVDMQQPLVLIIEDNGDIAELLANHLSSMYQVIIASNGAEGLALAQVHLPDVVITDVMMPIMDGWAFLKAFRKVRIFKAIPVIILTARTEAEDLHQSLSSGADAYLPKPFSLETVHLQIQNLLALQKEIAQKARVQLLVPEMIQTDTPSVVAPDAHFIQALNDLILAHLDDPHLEVEGLANALGMSRSVLFRRLKDALQEPPKQYIHRIRMEQAMKMLEYGMPATQVGFAIGYKSLSGFSKAFKAFFGKPPSDVSPNLPD